MKDLFAKRPFFQIGLIALLLIPVLIQLNNYGPPIDKAPEGYNSSILAFEFVSNQTELNEVLGPLTSAEIENLDKLNKLDYLFMLLYGLVIFLFMTRLGQEVSHSWLLLARWIAPVIVIMDLIENLQLLKLSAGFVQGSAEMDYTIGLLIIFTWSKWLLLAVAFAMIGLGVLKTKRRRWLGYFFYLPLSCGVMALIYQGNPDWTNVLEDQFGTSVFIAFFLMLIFCFLYSKEQ